VILLDEFADLTWKVVDVIGVDLVAAGTHPTYSIKMRTFNGEPHKIAAAKFWESGSLFRSGAITAPTITVKSVQSLVA
jgi:hypothetical protein